MGVCELCATRRATIRRPKTAQSVCRECFFEVFEMEVHRTIVDNKLFKRGDKVAIAASGGKGARFASLLFRNLTLCRLRLYCACARDEAVE